MDSIPKLIVSENPLENRTERRDLVSHTEGPVMTEEIEAKEMTQVIENKEKTEVIGIDTCVTNHPSQQRIYIAIEDEYDSGYEDSKQSLLDLHPNLHNHIFSFLTQVEKMKCRLVCRKLNRRILPHITTYFASNDIQLTRLLGSQFFPYIESLHIDRLMKRDAKRSEMLTAYTIIEVVSALLRRCGPSETDPSAQSDAMRRSRRRTKKIQSPQNRGMLSDDTSIAASSLNDDANEGLNADNDTNFESQIDTDIDTNIDTNADTILDGDIDVDIDGYTDFCNPADFEDLSDIPEVATQGDTYSEGCSTGHSIQYPVDEWMSLADNTLDSIYEDYRSNFLASRKVQLKELHIKYFNLNYAGKLSRDRYDSMFLKGLFATCGELISQQVEHLTILTLDVDDNTVGTLIQNYSSSLRSLSLWGNSSITNASIMKLVNSPLRHQLKRLELGAFGVMITDCSLIAISECMPQLEYLNLCRCSSLTNKSVSVMAKGLTQLKYLNLGFAPNVTNESLMIITKEILGLEELRLRRCSISEDGLKDIQNLTKLKVLELSETPITTLAPLVGVRNSLERLEIDRCERLLHLDALSSLHKLKHLSIGNYFKLDDSKIQFFVQLSNLQFLEICCGRLSDESFILISTLSRLRELHLHHSCRITDAGFNAICKNLPHLEALTCSRCEHVSVDTIANLRHLINLKSLDLTSGELRKHLFEEKLSFFVKIPYVRL